MNYMECTGTSFKIQDHINGLVQDCSNSIANTLEFMQSCTKPVIYALVLSTKQQQKQIKNAHTDTTGNTFSDYFKFLLLFHKYFHFVVFIKIN